MKRALFLLLVACPNYRSVGVTFGDDAEGLDDFLCKDNSGTMLLDRLGADAGTGYACLVADFIDMQGLPGCRTGQLVRWCSTHSCKPIGSTRFKTPMVLPTGVTGMAREDVRKLVQKQIDSLKGQQVIGDAPAQGTILRVIATGQSCDELGAGTEFDKTRLVGCAYSCPTLFDKADQDVYLGFETLTATCDQGVRICADGELHWQP
jgi:hypothetical protein